MNMHNSPAFSDLHYYKAKAPAMHGKAKKTSIRRLRFGGLYWTRTNDPRDVNTVLYQLSQQTKLSGGEARCALADSIILLQLRCFVKGIWSKKQMFSRAQQGRGEECAKRARFEPAMAGAREKRRFAGEGGGFIALIAPCRYAQVMTSRSARFVPGSPCRAFCGGGAFPREHPHAPRFCRCAMKAFPLRLARSSRFRGLGGGGAFSWDGLRAPRFCRCATKAFPLRLARSSRFRGLCGGSAFSWDGLRAPCFCRCATKAFSLRFAPSARLCCALR